ncbi:MAG: methyl-accepting chemotaxis protein [Pseudomonadales bacterium]
MNNKEPVRGSDSGNTPTIILLLIFLAALAVFIYSLVVTGRDAGFDARYQEVTAELRVLSQQISSSSRLAISGDAQAFEMLNTSSGEFDKNLSLLESGNEDLPSPKSMIETELSALSSEWQPIREAANTMSANKDRILFLHEVAKTLNDSIPELQQEYNNVVEILLESRAPSDQVAVAQRQSWLAERIARNVDKMLEGGAGADQAADQFNLDASLFGSVLDGMLNRNAAMRITRVTDADARASLVEISKLFEFVSGSVDEIFQASPDLLEARRAADAIVVGAPELMTGTGAVSEGISGLSLRRPVTTNWSLIAGAVMLVAMLLFGYFMIRNTRRRLAATAETNDQNQQAILRLLDEIGDLADGDLTTNATVTEDFTGAIADSVNYAIGQLRELVSKINDTAVSVSGAAEQNQRDALGLAEASEKQAKEISGASSAVNEMAKTIDQVSSNAGESASVAERSVEIANSGGQLVRNTITGMDNIREQIQDTSKRIKRLGESSQEIGDIVSLINDIADQTNILALNAAIQASMAGDAGRGFAVVADEVQRLAERSGAATKQIEALVKTIQSDTNEAVISMEQTTTEVVRGARLAQDAGVALEEIENVSTTLAELIQNISNAARQQAMTAGNISNTMGVVQEIASQTSEGTKLSSDSIGRLASMTSELRESVAGFKLPSDQADTEQTDQLEDMESFLGIETSDSDGGGSRVESAA